MVIQTKSVQIVRTKFVQLLCGNLLLQIVIDLYWDFDCYLPQTLLPPTRLHVLRVPRHDRHRLSSVDLRTRERHSSLQRFHVILQYKYFI